MAIYRLSEMVRMRREALGMTQDELIEISDGVDTQDNVICSTDTLRRIEKGRITRVKNEVFKKIMMRFGVLPERVYSSIFVMDSKALNLKAEIHVHICRNEFKQSCFSSSSFSPFLSLAFALKIKIRARFATFDVPYSSSKESRTGMYRGNYTLH